MGGNRAGLRDHLGGAGAAGLFGALVAGPQQLFDSGGGWDFLLALSLGAVTGGTVGFAFPYALRRGRRDRPAVPPPPHPPHPPTERGP